MKLTRKKMLCIIATIALISVAIICAYSFSSANRSKRQEETQKPKETTESITEEPTETQTLEIGDYLADEGTTESEETTTEEKPQIIVRELAFESNNNGTCTLVGIGNVTDTCIVIPEKSSNGDVVTSIAENAFYGNTKINTVQLPSTITSIGEKAFGGCTSIVYISVNSANTCFKDIDGVLYSKSGDTLIHYPAQKGNEAISIPKSVVKISDMAFYNCASLRKISYSGSMADWSKILIGEKNYGLYSASVICSDSPAGK